MKTLADYIAAERRRRGLTARQLASLAGYKQLNKGERRITKFENTGHEVGPFIARLCNALGCSLSAIEQKLDKDVIEQNERLLARYLLRHGERPAPTFFVVRCFAGCYVRRCLNGRGTTLREAVTEARAFARSWSHQVVLPLDSQRHVLLDESGRVRSFRQS